MMDRMNQSPVGPPRATPTNAGCFVPVACTIRMMDVLDGSDHSSFLKDWVTRAKPTLQHGHGHVDLVLRSGRDQPPRVSARKARRFSCQHMLEVVDSVFARDQYDRARKGLGHSFLGFGYAREWASACVGTMDVDSGPIAPFLEASAGASGMAVLGAAVFEDDAFLDQLLPSLEFAAFPGPSMTNWSFAPVTRWGTPFSSMPSSRALWKRVMEGRI